jgi:uncharacterized membrane protein YhaH (DUF805 family)
MRGVVLRYDDSAGSGFISGDDGVRYPFKRSDLQQLRPIASGTKVDFVPNAGAAEEVFIIDASGAIASGSDWGAANGGRAAVAEYTGEDLGLWDYFKKVMGKSFSGEGRARRKEYWSFALFVFLVFTVLTIAMLVTTGSAMASYSYDNENSGLVVALGAWVSVLVVISLIFLPAAITVMIRRLHDIGLSGWLYLLTFVPYLGAIFLFVCALIPSQAQVNKHGPIPKPRP